jgi:RNA polymerase sigma-70 factor (ECF subfamily)
MRDSFAVIYRSTFTEVYAYVFHRCGGVQSITEDLVQETYLAAVKALGSDGHAEVNLPWLIGVARHKIVDHFRAREREQRRLTLVAGDQAAIDVARGSGKAARERAMHALDLVPAAQRAALVLRYLDDLPVPEVARVLGKSVHATESLLARGRENFKRRFQEAENA